MCKSTVWQSRRGCAVRVCLRDIKVHSGAVEFVKLQDAYRPLSLCASL